MSTMKDREIKEIFRPDMIHLLMEAKKGILSCPQCFSIFMGDKVVPVDAKMQ